MHWVGENASNRVPWGWLWSVRIVLFFFFHKVAVQSFTSNAVASFSIASIVFCFLWNWIKWIQLTCRISQKSSLKRGCVIYQEYQYIVSWNMQSYKAVEDFKSLTHSRWIQTGTFCTFFSIKAQNNFVVKICWRLKGDVFC